MIQFAAVLLSVFLNASLAGAETIKIENIPRFQDTSYLDLKAGSQARIIEHERFSFELPPGWELWGRTYDLDPKNRTWGSRLLSFFFYFVPEKYTHLLDYELKVRLSAVQPDGAPAEELQVYHYPKMLNIETVMKVYEVDERPAEREDQGAKWYTFKPSQEEHATFEDWVIIGKQNALRLTLRSHSQEGRDRALQLLKTIKLNF